MQKNSRFTSDKAKHAKILRGVSSQSILEIACVIIAFCVRDFLKVCVNYTNGLLLSSIELLWTDGICFIFRLQSRDQAFACHKLLLSFDFLVWTHFPLSYWKFARYHVPHSIPVPGIGATPNECFSHYLISLRAEVVNFFLLFFDHEREIRHVLKISVVF